MFKIVYLCVLLLLVVAVAVMARRIRKKKDEVSKSLYRLLWVAIVNVVANGIFVMTNNAQVAIIMHSIFIAGIDWLLLMLLRYAYVYTERPERSVFFRVICDVIAVAESISIAFNPAKHHVFHLQKGYSDDFGTYFTPTDYTGWFYLHLGFSYVLAIWVGILLILKTKKTAKLYRLRYNSILFAFVVVLIVDAIGMQMNFPVDISLLCYCAACVVIAFFSLDYVPRAMTDRVLFNALSATDMGVGCVDLNGKCIYVNKHGEDMLVKYWGLSIKDDIDQVQERFKDKVEGCWKTELSEQTYLQKFTYEEKEYHYEFYVQRMVDEDGAFLGYFITCQDRTASILQYEEEHYKATHDALTGIYNEQYFQKVADKKIHTMGKSYVMLTSDIKDFKLINDIYGMERGDEILRQEARFLKELAKEDDVYGRLGEDHFALCMPKERFDEKVFDSLMEQISDAFADEFFRIQMYMGVYEIVDVTEPIFTMIDKCNLAIANIKGDYSSKVAYFDNELLQQEVKKNKIITELDNALMTGQIQMYLQGQCDKQGNLVGAEALARWFHPVKGLISPGEFIPVLERSGLIYKLDSKIWEMAAAKLADWKEKGLEDMSISINISVQDQAHLDVYETLKGLVERYHISPKNLKLEITETLFVENMENHRNLLQQLQDYGFFIEIDDFGSGYSSLNVLKDIEADVIKFDMGFLKQSEREERSRHILSSLVQLILQMDMDIIVEGVELQNQLEELVEMGCEHFQGYYFCRPMPVEDFEEKYHLGVS